MNKDTTTEPALNPQPEPQANSGGNHVRASWNFSLHDIRMNLAHCSHEAKEILIACFLWCIEPKHPVSRPEFAQAIDYDASTIYRIYSGKYINATTRERLEVPPKMVDAARAWLARQRKAYTPIGEFILTPTAERIFLACNLARESKTPVFLWGRSHIGKTWALEKFTADNNHGRTIYVRMKAATGLGGMVKRINERCGNSDKANTADSIDRIKRALTPDTLLILDELHLLQYTYRLNSFFACLEVIREIYDEVGCGMLLCGTELLLEKMRGGKQGEMEQLLRRGVHKFHLPKMPSKEDIAAILGHYGIKFPAKREVVNIEVDGQHISEISYDLLRQLAKDDGIKSITERLRYAEKIASKAKTFATMDHFVEADTRIKSNRIVDNSDWD
jgi:DNA transposition AAA+ family ATPase